MSKDLDWDDTEESAEWEILLSEEKWPQSVKERIEVMQKLMAYRGTEQYGKIEEKAAEKLGITQRSIQRIVKKWLEKGLSGVLRQKRSDVGQRKTPEEWQKWIIKTYKEGNRGSRKMSKAQVYLRVRGRAQELEIEDYPSRSTVYRILKSYEEKGKRKAQSLGWKGEELTLKSREGLEIKVEYSNQVWQSDHTKVDLLVVGQNGEILGRPWLTTVIDSYSRCIMGINLGFDAPSAEVVCLALRHAILPKQYTSAYQLKESWETYGLPKYIYTDGGKDFRSQHLERVAMELGIVLCLRRKPSDGGIVERPFGTLNQELFSSLPGYTGSNVSERSPEAEKEACLTLRELEQLLVRYIVDNYNQRIDGRMGNQSRIGRWEAGRIAELSLLGERELDICLMRKERRRVYRSGYIQFANLTYLGEHLGAYAGEIVSIRYNPRDITTILIYHQQGSKEVFLTRAHAVGWETETLSMAEAKSIAKHRRETGRMMSNGSMLEEVSEREKKIKQVQRQKRAEKEGMSQPTSSTSQKVSKESQRETEEIITSSTESLSGNRRLKDGKNLC